MEQKTDYNQQEAEEQKQLLLLAQMARRRKEHPAPDADQAWQRFAAIHSAKEEETDGQKPPKRLFKPISLWLSAVGGAAAACVIMFLVQQWVPWTGHSPYVALRYDATAQRLRIGEHDTILPNGQERFLSFYDASAPLRGTTDRGITTPMATAAPAIFPSAPHQTPETECPAVRTRKLSTPRGMDFRVLLPDSSEVWLNAESTIEFPVAFNSGERRVELHGEAYFKVARNEQIPFVVHTDRMKVSVLGTEFNLRAYDTDVSSLALVKGSVQVSSDGDEVLLSPGQEVECSREGSLLVRDIDTYYVTQWTEGLFYFDDKPLVEVLKELGRWYNLGVVFHRKALMEMRMHFSASRADDIDTAIRNLNRLRKVRITIEEENIVVY